MGKVILLIFFIFQFPGIPFCQDTLRVKKVFHQQDIKDWFAQVGWTKKKPAKNNFMLIIPVVASNPTAGFIFGGGLTYAFKTSGTDRHLSTISANATYSTNQLLNLNVKSNAFVLNERLVLNSDWRFLINSETTYGLGTTKYNSAYININGYETSSDSLGQQMQYNQIRIYETGSWKLFPNFFAGLGIHYDYHYNIKDGQLATGDSSLSYHYQYSKQHGFDPQKYSTTGFSLNLLYDSRDNQVNAYKGYYANINYRINLTGLGSSKGSTMLLTEYRSYHSLDGQRSRHLLAFWFYGSFVISGNVPYLLLPALGYDQRQRSGRGYTFGRFRGEEMLYGESEYRFPISKNSGILGGVLFFNATSTSDKRHDVLLLDYIRAGYGGGMRIMLDKNSRTRLEADLGIANRSIGLYLGAQETF